MTLAYLLEREPSRYWYEIHMTVAEGIDQLSSLCDIVLESDPVGTQRIPKSNPLCQTLLEAAAVSMPQPISYMEPAEATRRKLPAKQ